MGLLSGKHAVLLLPPAIKNGCLTYAVNITDRIYNGGGGSIPQNRFYVYCRKVRLFNELQLNIFVYS